MVSSQLANLFQGALELVVILQPAAHLRDPFFAQTDLARNATRIANGEHPDGVAFAALALGAALAMADRAFEQRATQDSAEVGQVSQEAPAFRDSLLMFHQ
jgi:hypothetical protein